MRLGAGSSGTSSLSAAARFLPFPGLIAAPSAADEGALVAALLVRLLFATLAAFVLALLLPTDDIARRRRLFARGLCTKQAKGQTATTQRERVHVQWTYGT